MFSGKVHVWFDNAGKGRGYGFIIPDLGGDDVMSLYTGSSWETPTIWKAATQALMILSGTRGK